MRDLFLRLSNGGGGGRNAALAFCLLFYVLATSNGISGRVPTCDSANSWRLYNTASLEHQTPWPDIPLSHIILTLSQPALYPILIMPSASPGSRKYQFKSFWFDSTRFGSCINNSPIPLWSCLVNLVNMACRAWLESIILTIPGQVDYPIFYLASFPTATSTWGRMSV